MIELIVVAATVLAAGAIGLVANRRRADPPTSPRFAVPQQVDRGDFPGADRAWLLAVFSSATCASCAEAWDAVSAVAADAIEVARLDHGSHRSLHDRYDVDAVPTVILADEEGVVRWSYLGAPPRSAIAETLTDLGIVPRDGGTAVDFG